MEVWRLNWGMEEWRYGGLNAPKISPIVPPLRSKVSLIFLAVKWFEKAPRRPSRAMKDSSFKFTSFASKLFPAYIRTHKAFTTSPKSLDPLSSPILRPLTCPFRERLRVMCIACRGRERSLRCMYCTYTLALYVIRVIM